MKLFDKSQLKDLYQPSSNSMSEQNGQVTIIGGSKLFHGAPIFALKVASRIVDMVFLASPDDSIGKVADNIKSKLMSFIWTDWDDVENYIAKSDAVLIGPGFMRFTSESQNPNDQVQMTNNGNGKKTRDITVRLLKKFPNKRWVVDGGSLQVMEAEWIPRGAIITPNRKEFEILFGNEIRDKQDEICGDKNRIASHISLFAKRNKCIIVAKGPETIVSDGIRTVLVKGGNAGMTKGGTGDVLAGLTVALLAKSDPFLAVCSASYITKAAADDLYEKVGVNYNADDLADQIPVTLQNVIRNM